MAIAKMMFDAADAFPSVFWPRNTFSDIISTKLMAKQATIFSVCYRIIVSSVPEGLRYSVDHESQTRLSFAQPINKLYNQTRDPKADRVD